MKHSHDEKTLQLQSEAHVSRAYPFPYGFILGTTAEDGDNIDCFVLTSKALRTGQIVECHAIGLMEQFEDGQIDHNVLAVLPNETTELTCQIKQKLTDFVRHVFDHIPGKKIQAGEFLGADAASQHIEQYQD